MTPPIPLALLMCDHVWQDPSNGKHNLLGTFSRLGGAAFPLVTTLSVYFAVTEAHGCLPVRMELIDVDEERPAVLDAQIPFEFTDLRQVIEGTFTFSNVVIPAPSEYRLKLFVGGEFLTERTLHVEESRKECMTDG